MRAGRMRYRRLPWLLGGYLALLILAATLVYLLPREGFAQQDILSPRERARAESASWNLYEAAQAGELAKVERVSINGEWNLEFTEKQLELAFTDPGTAIIAERKASDDQQIEVVSYLTPTVSQGIDFTSKINPPKVSLEGRKLLIKPGEPYQAEFVFFKKDATVAQFLGESMEQRPPDYNVNVFGSKLLYLRIPKSLQIETDNPGFQVIGEE